MLEWIRRGRLASHRRRMLIGMLLGLLLIWSLGGLAFWRCAVVGACWHSGPEEPGLPAAPDSAPVAWLGDRMLVTGRQALAFESGRAPPLAQHRDFFRALADWLTARPDQLVVITAHFGEDERAEVGMNRARWARAALIAAGVPDTAAVAWHRRGTARGLGFRVARLAELPPVSGMEVDFAPGGAVDWTPHGIRVLAAMRQAMAVDAGARIRVEAGADLRARERALAAADQLVRLGFPGRRVDIGSRTGQASGTAMTVRLVREQGDDTEDA